MADFLLPVETIFTTTDSTVFNIKLTQYTWYIKTDLNYKNVLSCSSSLFFFYFQ